VSGGSHDAANRRGIVIFHFPAERVGHQLAGDGADELLLVRYERLPELCRPGHFRTVQQHTRRVDGAACVGGAPMTDCIKIFQRKSKRIHLPVARGAGRVRSVLLHLVGKGGLPKQHWSAAGFADTDPVASNDSDDGRQKNRRCDLIVVPSVEVIARK